VGRVYPKEVTPPLRPPAAGDPDDMSSGSRSDKGSPIGRGLILEPWSPRGLVWPSHPDNTSWPPAVLTGAVLLFFHNFTTVDLTFVRNYLESRHRLDSTAIPDRPGEACQRVRRLSTGKSRLTLTALSHP
jgi:hypothetical protein